MFSDASDKLRTNGWCGQTEQHCHGKREARGLCAPSVTANLNMCISSFPMPGILMQRCGIGGSHVTPFHVVVKMCISLLRKYAHF